MRVPKAVYRSATCSAPWASLTAAATRSRRRPIPWATLDRSGSVPSAYLASLTMRREMKRQSTSSGRRAATSCTQRDVIHAHGHTGSQKNSTSAM
jgi:hypothetical protein